MLPLCAPTRPTGPSERIRQEPPQLRCEPSHLSHELFCLLVEGRPLLDGLEPRVPLRRPRLGGGLVPLARLPRLAPLDAHDLPALALHEVILLQALLGLGLLTSEDLHLRPLPRRDDRHLHGLHHLLHDRLGLRLRLRPHRPLRGRLWLRPSGLHDLHRHRRRRCRRHGGTHLQHLHRLVLGDREPEAHHARLHRRRAALHRQGLLVLAFQDGLERDRLLAGAPLLVEVGVDLVLAGGRVLPEDVLDRLVDHVVVGRVHVHVQVAAGRLLLFVADVGLPARGQLHLGVEVEVAGVVPCEGRGDGASLCVLTDQPAVEVLVRDPR
mmetsp:Transcript_5669/g.16118  ORF Transcript_5669/g.16118 Transcript_5669/m.16118 type:complete len:324 (-) Transcript_5669:109-1080(-)